RSHSSAAARHTVLDATKVFAGHVAVVPVHASATSQKPAEARQVAPALPAGCWHASLEPLQASSVHGLPSSVHAVPFDCFASAGQAAVEPVQFSARSHSSAAARQTVLDATKVFAGHVAVVPVHVSATSQKPAEARQVAPALPAGCWHASLEPLQASSVHGLPSSVHE